MRVQIPPGVLLYIISFTSNCGILRESERVGGRKKKLKKIADACKALLKKWKADYLALIDPKRDPRIDIASPASDLIDRKEKIDEYHSNLPKDYDFGITSDIEETNGNVAHVKAILANYLRSQKDDELR